MKSNRIPTDIGLTQVVKERSDGTNVGEKLPSPRRYRGALIALLKSYPRITRSLTPWNEPQLKSNKTSRNPFRAARFWFAAQRVCKPYNGGPERCTGEVLAGDYAGTAGSVTWTPPHQRRKLRWEASYRDYMYGAIKASRQRGVPKRRKLHRPRVWAFHAYEDIKRRALIRKDRNDRSQGPPIAHRTPVLEHYFQEFKKSIYRYGSGEGTPVNVWITAVGAPYKQKCRLGKNYDSDYCTLVPPQANDREASGYGALLGTKRQADGLRFFMRRLTGRYRRSNGNPFEDVPFAVELGGGGPW